MSPIRKKTVVKAATKPATALVPRNMAPAAAPKKGGKESIPLIIRNKPHLLKLWEHATEEEKLAGMILSEFQSKSNKSAIDTYFDLADKWNDTFPKTNKKLRDYGEKAVVKGAKIAGISSSTVWSILRTAGFYGRSGYEALNKKAQTNGVVLYWTHLRIIVERLHDDKAARTKVELALVQNQMTESQLDTLIEEVAPGAKQTRALPSGNGSANPIQGFLSMNSALRTLAKQRAKFEGAIESLDAEFNGDGGQAKSVFEQTVAWIAVCHEILNFIDTQSERIQRLHDAAQTIVDKEAAQEQAKEKAEAIKYQMTHEKAEQQKKKAERAAAQVTRGDLASEVEIDEDEEEELMEDAEEEFEEEFDPDDINIDDEQVAGELWDEMGNIR
jgi:hypothetical protein